MSDGSRASSGQRLALALGPLSLAGALTLGSASFVGAALSESDDDVTGFVSLGALVLVVGGVMALALGLAALAWCRALPRAAAIAIATIAAAVVFLSAAPIGWFVFFFATTPWWELS